jgi:hypothetical protein
MASHSESRISTFKATAAINKGCAVFPGATNEYVTVATAVSSKMIGIAQNTVTTAGDLVEVAMPGGGAFAKCGSTVALGDLLTSDSSGELIPCTTTRDRIIGVALEAAADGDYFSIEVQVGIY